MSALDGVSGDLYDGCERPQPSSPDQRRPNLPFEAEHEHDDEHEDDFKKRRAPTQSVGLLPEL
jgi:hypothetical protein